MPGGKRLDAELFVHLFVHGGKHSIPHVDAAVVRSGMQRRRVRHAELVKASVAGREVDEHVGLPIAQEAQERARFGRFGADEIVVEIDPLRVRTRPDADGTVLVGSVEVLRSEVFVCIDVEYGYHDEHEVLEQRLLGRQAEIAHDGEDRFLSLDLAAVARPLHEHDRPFERARFGGRSHHRTRGDDVRDFAALERRSDRSLRDGRAALIEFGEESLYVGERRRLAIVARLRTRRQLVAQRRFRHDRGCRNRRRRERRRRRREKVAALHGVAGSGEKLPAAAITRSAGPM